jgi:hypothetical protein
MAEVLSSNYRPTTFEEAKKLITDIRHEAGVVDQSDENELQKTSQDFASRYRRDREKHRSILARYTKT